MVKELYLYSPIYDFVAQELIAAMEENSDEDICIRMNTPGGNVFAGWGIIAKMQERTGKTNLKVDGAVMSMGAMILLFADNVEALDVSTIMLHRAIGSTETPEDIKFLDTVNKSLRAKMTSKIDDAKLLELKGVSIKDLFEGEERVNCFLTASEAKKVGLVNKITKLTAKEVTAFNEKMFNIAAEHVTENNNENPKKITMKNLDELKAQFPSIYSEAIAKGKRIGAKKEKDRIEACLVFADVDLPGVQKIIASGDSMSQAQIIEFSRKAASVDALKKIEEEAPAAVVTAESDVAKTEKEKQLAAFEKEVGTHTDVIAEKK